MIEKIEAEWHYDGHSEYQRYSQTEMASKINELIEAVNFLLQQPTTTSSSSSFSEET